MAFSRRKLLQGAATAMAVAGLAVGMSAGTASANGTNGWYQLCSQGTYSSVIEYGVQTAPTDTTPKLNTSYIAPPGQCVPIYMDGSAVDVYMIYDDGGKKNLGRAWYQANIATTGYKSTAGWHFF